MGATEILLSMLVLSVASADGGGYNVGKQNYGGRHMNYYEGETVPLEWSDLDPHGCDQGCDIVLQYTSYPISGPISRQDNGKGKGKGSSALRGALPQSEQAEPVETASSRPLSFEPTACQSDSVTGTRNKGLFNADQNSAERKSWEVDCPEEREYYPYWRPSEWVDLAFITTDKQKCDSYHASSANNVGLGAFSTQATPPPPCLSTGEATRPNHLGLIGGEKQWMYNWAVPSIFRGRDGAYDGVRVVLRIRYNISTVTDGTRKKFRIDEQRVEVEFTKPPLTERPRTIFP